MKTKRFWLTTIAAIFLFAGYMIGCKDEYVEIIGVCPIVVSTNPTNLATNVPLDQIITVTFNVEMNPATLTQASFSLQEQVVTTKMQNSEVTGKVSSTSKQGNPEITSKSLSSVSTTIVGTVTYSGLTATFTPSSPLTTNATYTGRIASTVKDLKGNYLQTDYVWTFYTGVPISPAVISTDPLNLATNVPLDKTISANFNMAMDPASFSTSTFTLLDGDTPIPGVVEYSGTTATFNPSNDLELGITYTATITTGATNTDGLPIENNFVWTFSTGALIAPRVISTDPLTIATNVDLNKTINAVFSVVMNPATINTSTFTLMDGATPIAGVVNYSGTTASFNPSSDLEEGVTYTATIFSGVANEAGTEMGKNYVWTFSTGTVIAPTVISTDPINLATNVPLDKTINANFNLPMNQATITTATFILMNGATPITGVVNYSGTTATFNPSSDLEAGVTYTATITSAVASETGTEMGGNYVWTFSTGPVIAPTVISTDPLNLATNVVLNKTISAVFSVVMDPATITSSTFILMDGVTPIPGVVGYSGTTATLNPSSDLVVGRTYTATITTSVTNAVGTALNSNYVWTFSTGTAVAPTVISTDPVNLASNVALDKTISANFSIAMDPATITASTFTLMDGVTPVPGEIGYSGTTATLNPSSDLVLGKTYTATITTGVTNVGGTALSSNYVWTFSTGAAVAPTVILTDPVNLAINVALDKTISATFSVAMNPTTITTSTFILMDGATPVPGVIGYSGTTATLNPTNDLELGKTYTATITTGVKNIGGTALSSNYVWTFSTGAAVAPTVISTDPVNLATNVDLDRTISANFSVAMNPATITTSTFILMDGVTPIPGVIGYSGTTATLNPSSNLVLGKTYTATITTGATNAAGTALSSNYVWTFSTGAAIAPIVINTDPVNLATNVALNKTISASFSTAMDPATITSSTFTLMDGVTPVPGVIGYSGTTATLNPTNDLVLGKTYTATITTGVENAGGTALANNYVWTFSTGAAIAPTVISTDPENLAIDVLYNKTISATFSVVMDQSTVTTSTFTLMNGALPVVGVVNYAGVVATFNPTADLLPGVTYTATITTGVENEAGTALAENFVWSFTTQYSLTVIAVNGTVNIDPEELGYNFEDEVELTATADNGYTFGSWSGDATGTNNPLTVIMDENKIITANFTENEPLGPGIVDLGSAGDFAILTKTGISTVGTTLITGHIGVTPATSTAITGFSQTMDASGEFSTSIYVVGNIYAADYLPPTPTYVGTAMSDQETAFTTAMGLVTDVINDLGAGDVSGMTLVPGLYKWGTGLLISNAGVTLAGGPNDTWVFQIADDFTIANDAIITLTGGALAKNIFWVTSTQALIGSNVIFSGNILSQTLISLTAGTTVYGRLLAQTAVTLNSSTVTKPSDK